MQPLCICGRKASLRLSLSHNPPMCEPPRMTYIVMIIKWPFVFFLAALVGPYIIVHNEGQHDMDIDVKEPSSNTNNDKKPLHLVKGAFGQVCNLLSYNICFRCSWIVYIFKSNRWCKLPEWLISQINFGSNMVRHEFQILFTYGVTHFIVPHCFMCSFGACSSRVCTFELLDWIDCLWIPFDIGIWEATCDIWN
jgi:hypothetical protein